MTENTYPSKQLTFNMNSVSKLIKKGMRNPPKVPPYILGKVFPNSRWGTGTNVDKRNEYITFTPGGFAASPSGRPDFSAKSYYEVRELRRLLTEYLSTVPVEKSLEVGCGYGRLSPWIAEFSKDSYAIEPNEDALSEAQVQYPDIQFRNENAIDISFEDGCFDVVVTWTVLQHIPPHSIKDACNEIYRVTKEQGIVLIAEATGDADGPVGWGRSDSEYADLLQMELQMSKSKPVERTFNKNNTAIKHPDDTLMVFSKT